MALTNEQVQQLRSKYKLGTDPQTETTTVGSLFGITNTVKGIKQAFDAAAVKTKEGIDQATTWNTTDPTASTRGVLKAGAGVVEALGAPLAPVVQPVMNKVVDTLASTKPVQNYANMIPEGGLTENLMQSQADAGSIAGLMLGSKGATTATEGGMNAIKNTASKVKLPEIPATDGLAASLQSRATRLTPSVRNEFKAMTGKTPEEFQIEYGATGTPDQVVSKLYEQFTTSRQAVDAALQTAKPVRYQVPAFKDALDALRLKVEKTSTEGAPNPISEEVANLSKIYDSTGLTVAQENSIKRLYEMNVKLDYLKENVPDNVTLAKNIDSQLRNTVEKHADQLGIKGVKEQNKITQATRYLMDEIGKASNGRAANNILGLTDTILAAQIPATPEALALFLGKKALSSETVLGGAAKVLSPKPKPTKVIKSTKPNYPVKDLGTSNPTKPRQTKGK